MHTSCSVLAACAGYKSHGSAPKRFANIRGLTILPHVLELEKCRRVHVAAPGLLWTAARRTSAQTHSHPLGAGPNEAVANGNFDHGDQVAKVGLEMQPAKITV